MPDSESHPKSEVEFAIELLMLDELVQQATYWEMIAQDAYTQAEGILHRAQSNLRKNVERRKSLVEQMKREGIDLAQ